MTSEESVSRARALVSIVVPVYRSTSTVIELCDRIRSTLSPTWDYEIVLVDDGSGEVTWRTLRTLADQDAHVRCIRLSRNYGQHSALLAGLREAAGTITVTLDDDLQNPPEMIPRLVEHFLQTGSDVVYGVPHTVRQPWSRRLSSQVVRRSLASGMGASEASDVTSFRAFRTSLREGFDGDLGTGVSLDALLGWAASTYSSVRVDHFAREVGSSTYSAGRLIRFAVDTVTGYSARPLQLASVLGFCTAFVGFAALIWVLVRPLLTGQSVPGFPFLASTIALFSGVQLFTLGVMGEYLARMHFRIMRKPTYVVAERAGRRPHD